MVREFTYLHIHTYIPSSSDPLKAFSGSAARIPNTMMLVTIM
jgi:hypothetical protein